MRKIVVYELLSLDGVAEDPEKFFTVWDDAMEANLAAGAVDELRLVIAPANCSPSAFPPIATRATGRSSARPPPR